MHLRIISALLSPSSWAGIPLMGTTVIMRYLLRRDMMLYIARALEQVVCQLLLYFLFLFFVQLTTH